MFSFKNWVTAPQIGFPLVLNDATLEAVLKEISEYKKAYNWLITSKGFSWFKGPDK